MHRLKVTSLGSARSGLSLVSIGVALWAAGCGSSSSNGAGVPPGAGAPPGGGDAGAAEAGPPGDCLSGDITPCSSFTTPTGTKVALGPYGAQMDENVGKGFENAIQMGDMLPANASTCQGFANLFGEDPKLTAKLLQTTQNGVTIDFSLYSVYRPAAWKAGETYPVITWGNGTCAQPEGYGALLRYVASYGFVVVAANSRWVGSGSPQPMLHALDYAAAANADPKSPYYQKLDLTNVGAMGHSQGGQATATAASDPRIKDVIIFNAVDSGVAKPYLTTSGDMDITMFTAASMASAIDASTVPAAYLYYLNPAGVGPLRGHLVLMLSPDRVTGPTLAWWQMTLKSDASSKSWFEGDSCMLCNMSTEFNFGEHGLN